MTEQVTISIVVPVYNAGERLRACLHSLQVQTLDSIEIIVVDDGSTDDSASIVNQFSEKDSRIRLVSSDNRGVSHARNLGIEYARGTYIGFADADDFVESDMYLSLCESMKTDNSDLVICNVVVHEEDGKKTDRFNFNDGTIRLSAERKKFLNDLFDFRYDYANWNKLYRRSIIKDNGLIFRTDMRIWEDFMFNLMYVRHAESVSLLSKPLYHYRIHAGSVMGKSEDTLVVQYNLLYVNYHDYCMSNNMSTEFRDFNFKMAEGVYNNLYPRLSKKIRSSHSFFKSISLNTKLLEGFASGLLQFDLQGNSGYQKFKKKLLMNRRFRIYAVIDSFRNMMFN